MTRRRPPSLSHVTPSFHLFLGPAVNSDESIKVIINWMILLLCIWPPPFFFFLLIPYLSFMMMEVGGGVEYGSVSRPFIPFPFFWEAGV